MSEPKLTSARLSLRPLRVADADAVFKFASQNGFAEFLPLPDPYTPKDAQDFVAARLAEPWNSHPSFVIVVDGGPVGELNLRIDHATATAALGYGISPHYWNRGLMTEAAALAVSWAFHEQRVEKIWATADARNVASWRVMEKLGMRREAYLRSHRLLRGERVDVVQYGLLRDEWNEDRQPIRGSTGG